MSLKKEKNKILFSLILFFYAITPSVASAQLQSRSFLSEWEYKRSSESLLVGSELDKGVEYSDDKATFNVYRVISGKLRKDSLPFKDSQSADQKVWDLFIKIANKNFPKKMVREYATYQAPHEPVLGFVFSEQDHNPAWALGINVSSADFNNKKWVRDVVVVLIHEYAHLLTLSTDQVVYLEKGKPPCEKILNMRDNFAVERKACSTAKSYINNFVTMFWSNDQISRSKETYIDGITTEFYHQFKNEFLTEYAATSPTEDLAESFTEFILRRKPFGLNKGELKILFFYGYPELVEMRTRIRSQISEYFI